MGSLAAYVAIKKKYNPYLWFFIGFFFGIWGIFPIFFLNFKRKAKPISRPPLLFPRGPIDKFWYYLDASHNQVGPLSHQAISKALGEGIISDNTYVWNEEMTDWKLLKDLS